MLPKPPSELLQDIHWRVIDVKSMATCISHLTRPSRDPPKAPTTITTPSQHPLPTRRDPSTLPSGEHRGKAGVAAKPLLPRGDMLCMQVARRARSVGPIACSGWGAEYWRSGHAVSNTEGPHRGGGGEGGGRACVGGPIRVSAKLGGTISPMGGRFPTKAGSRWYLCCETASWNLDLVRHPGRAPLFEVAVRVWCRVAAGSEILVEVFFETRELVVVCSLAGCWCFGLSEDTREMFTRSTYDVAVFYDTVSDPDTVGTHHVRHHHVCK
jgi:hypothetical protein